MRKDLDLGNGDSDYIQKGGIYGKVITCDGYERHHIPAAAVLSENKNNLPIVMLTKEDHQKTDSYRGKQHKKYEPFLPTDSTSEGYKVEAAREIQSGGFILLVKCEIYM